MRLSCELPASDLRALVAVLPSLIGWWRSLRPDENGRLIPDDDLRLIAGTHARVGARYETGGREPALLTITEDAADLLEFSLDAPSVSAVVRAVDPTLPGSLHLGVRGEHHELSVLGHEYTATASLHAAADGELGVGEFRIKRLRVTARAVARRRGDRLRVRIRVRISPRGVLLPSALALLFLRRTLERDAQARLDEAVAWLSAAVAAGELDRAVRDLIAARGANGGTAGRA